MDTPFWNNFVPPKSGLSNSSGDNRQWLHHGGHHGSRDLLTEWDHARDRSGPSHSSNSSAELWTSDKELRLDDLDYGRPFRNSAFSSVKDKGFCRSTDSSLYPTKGHRSGHSQMKVAVYKNCGLLTVHIIQARHLSSPLRDSPCSAYVRVSVAPDQQRRTKCKTRVIPDTDYPTFDEKFSFEILEEDFRKRLLISVWNKRDDGTSDFLGCTSFGIRHLENKHKIIEGWYFLLSEEIGRNKHLKVSSSTDVTTCNDEGQSLGQCKIPHATKKTRIYTSTPRHLDRTGIMDPKTADDTLPSLLSLNMLHATDNDYTLEPGHLRLSTQKPVATEMTNPDPLPGRRLPDKVIVKRNTDGGFGFSVTGQVPVTVCSVQPNGPAVEAGLREDDVIETLNGQDVQFTSAHLVANAIRQSPDYIVLEIRRKTKPWTVWKPATLSEIPEYISARCPSPTSLSCDLISGLCSFGKEKKTKSKT